jgi:hypothetical protein
MAEEVIVALGTVLVVSYAFAQASMEYKLRIFPNLFSEGGSSHEGVLNMRKRYLFN